jgi:hypothetical protein
MSLFENIMIEPRVLNCGATVLIFEVLFALKCYCRLVHRVTTAYH